MSRVLPVVLLLAGGCIEDRPTEPKSTPPAEVRVAAGPGLTLCAGTKAWADAETARTIEVTGLPPEYPLRVELGAAAVAANCGDAPESGVRLGCSLGSGGGAKAFADPSAFSHELTHALRRQPGLATVPFFEEGWAEALNGSDAYPSFVELQPAETKLDIVQAVADAASLDGPGPYRVATHFMRFLAARHGEAAVSDFMRGGIDRNGTAAMDRFAQAFGEPLATAVGSWHDTTDGVAFRGDPCADAPMLDGTLTVQATVDCSQPDTYGLLGADEEVWTRRCFTMPAEATVTAAVDAGRVRLESVPTSCSVSDADPARGVHIVEPGTPTSALLAACRWTATFIDPGGGPTPITLTLQPG